MKPLKHQIEKSEEVYSKFVRFGIVYLAGQVRSGKTLTAILVANRSDAKKVLVLTKKAAIPGWNLFKDNMTKTFVVTNYEQINRVDSDFDLVILDEAHNLGCVGKPSQRVKDIRKKCYNKQLILLSGTPSAETKASLYHQMCISKHSPFDEFKNFYKWFAKYGIPTEQWIASRRINLYNLTKKELDAVIEPYFVVMTQEDAGITTKSEDVVHYVKLNQTTKERYNQLLKTGVLGDIVCDSIMKLRMTLHQLETGEEKFEYINSNFNGKVAVMSHFIDERERLAKFCQHVDIYSSNRHAEGVDLSRYDHFVILSGDYSGSKFIQRRERNVNINNTKVAIVHHLLVKNAISEQVYLSVSSKKDFNNQVFERIEL